MPHYLAKLSGERYSFTAQLIQFKVNGTKTELMWFGTLSSLRGLSPFDKSLAVGDVNLQPVESVRNLGVYFDSKLSMKARVSKTAQVCFSSYDVCTRFVVYSAATSHPI